jgi:hypothetical protein
LGGGEVNFGKKHALLVFTGETIKKGNLENSIN